MKTAHDGKPRVEESAENLDSIYIKCGIQLLKVKLSEILYVEGAGNYMTFYTTGK